MILTFYFQVDNITEGKPCDISNFLFSEYTSWGENRHTVYVSISSFYVYYQ